MSRRILIILIFVHFLLGTDLNVSILSFYRRYQKQSKTEMDIDVQPVNIKEAGDVGRVTICIRGHILPAFLSHIDNRMTHSPNTGHQYEQREILKRN